MATRKKSKGAAKRTSAPNADPEELLESLSTEELRAYLARREKGAGEPRTTKVRTQTTGQSSREPLSVHETLRGKRIFMIGGTGFLGRIMLYMLLKNATEVEKIYVLIRPTHGRTGNDRLHHEILESPVFTLGEGDREYFASIMKRKVQVVEGDASREDLAMNAEDAKLLREEADVVLNTAGNVEFNPPLDLSLNANAVATRAVLDFVESTKCKKYVHISTCYVADRSIHRERSPEKIVAQRILTSSGNEIVIDPEREIADAQATIADLKQLYENPRKHDEYREQAVRELHRIGRDDASDRLVEKTAKNLRTMALRERLIKEGKERAERLNRPNVYTYTKTLAELLVKSRGDRIDYTIVRPSIVETSVRYPFTGWNEGIQGSAPLMFLVYKGHRMLPSLADRADQPNAILDFIPVDEVAAGTILAMTALLRGEQSEIYQLAAGPQPSPITPGSLLNIFQIKLRERLNAEPPGLVRFLKRNLQAYPVTRRTFQRFSSPRTLKWLQRARTRLETLDTSRLPPAGANLVGRLETGIEKFYQLSMFKNRIFQEFMPFINEGYPTFENHNAIGLWERLSTEEREQFHFNPFDFDYTEYLADIHIEAVFEWIFPVLEKRLNAINKIGGDRSRKDESDSRLLGTLQTVFAPSDLEFRDRLHILRRATVERMRKRASRPARKDQGESAVTKTGTNTDDFPYIESHLRRFAGQNVADMGELSDDLLEQLARHFELITGMRLTVEALREFRTPSRLRKQLTRWQSDYERTRQRGPFGLQLSPDGAQLPAWFANPTRDFLYQLQMWFYRSVLDVRLAGTENIPLNNQNVIVVANHSSHLDYGLIWYSLGDYGRDMGILAARDYFFDRFIKSTFFGNLLNLVPIERGENAGYAESLKHAFAYLKRGGPLLIFPEGTRSHDGKIKPFRHGLGYLVEKSGADVLPIRLSNTHQALPKGKTVIRSTRVGVRFGELIPYESLKEETRGLSPTRTYHTISNRLHDAVVALPPV